VVITGGARGIGFGLALEFLKRGAAVMISSRGVQSLDAGLERLRTASGSVRVYGQLCEVSDPIQVQHLWDVSLRQFGKVDIWINNAGLGQAQCPLDQLPDETIDSICATNITGALYGCKTALAGMKQQKQGAIYNMEGLGSSGGLIVGMTVYGASKRALAYITDSLAKEAKGSSVLVGALRPGMTATDLITAEYRDRPDEWNKVRKIFNILSDTVETIAPWLVEHMLTNKKNGVRFTWLTGAKAAWRFMSSPFVKRQIYPDTL